MKQLQFRMRQYIFKPTLIGTLITLVCIPLFIKLGLWQYNKAQLAIHEAYDQAKLDEPLKFPIGVIDNKINNIEDWKYKKVTVKGVYETKYQFLLDNQVEGDRVGYHVITPLKIENSSEYVLVNRGWILAKDTHSELPIINTPTGIQTISGQIWVPSKKFFTLENNQTLVGENIDSKNNAWHAVWQNLDMAKYKHSVPLAISDLLIKLDQNSQAGGFVRNWQIPVERITTNLGYAYQWFGFAVAALLIYLYMSIVNVNPKNTKV